MTKRATSLEEYRALREKFGTEEGFEAGLAFQPRPSDVIISPFAKSGTTWLQQIAHGLRTRGSMDFEEITVVTPWLEVAHDLGWDVNAEQVAKPRLFKSHLDWYQIPKGGRYICSFRHPYDVAVSFYRFIGGWWFDVDHISLDDFIAERFTNAPERSGYWYHLASWWQQHDNPDVLLLCYEDMKADLPATIQKVADFIGVPLDDALLDIVLRQSSRDFMLAHKSQFNDHLIQHYFAARGGAPVNLDTAKVTPGASDDARYALSDEQKAAFDAIWQRMIEQRFGLKDYEALRLRLAQHHNR